jgi:hypothetical protein
MALRELLINNFEIDNFLALAKNSTHQTHHKCCDRLQAIRHQLLAISTQ